MKRARNGEKEVLSRRELYGLGMDRSFKVRSVTYCNVGQYGAGLQWPAVPEVLCYVCWLLFRWLEAFSAIAMTVHHRDTKFQETET